MGLGRMVVFRLPKGLRRAQFGYRYLVRIERSPSGWDFGEKYRFDTLSECLDFVNSQFV